MIYLNIKQLLKEKGKSKYWLVNQLNSGYQAVNDMMENRTKGIRFETIEKLCNVLECEPNDLFRFKN